MDEILGGVIVIMIIWIGASSFHLPTNGEHTGYVTAVQKSGYFFDTWTAYFKTNTQSSQEDRYCVTDPDMVSYLKNVQESNEKVTVEYKNSFFVPFWQCRGSDQSIITNSK